MRIAQEEIFGGVVVIPFKTSKRRSGSPTIIYGLGAAV